MVTKTVNQNGQGWQDVDGHNIQAHGGVIITYAGHYYWYGENKDTPNIKHHGVNMVPFIGINCYVSDNLIDWKLAGNVLNPASDPQKRLSEFSIVERPKVLFNAKTKQFVMWCHYDTLDYRFAGCLIATASQPTGPFSVKDIIRPNGKDSRDMTLYQDGNQAYLVHSSDMNKTMYFSALTDDYCGVTGFMAKAFVDQEREAPVIFKQADWYFTITSGTTGWKPNPALYSRSHFLFSGQKLIDNPCNGPLAQTTYNGQPAAMLSYQDQPYLLLDHWHRKDLQSSGYSLLPIEINGRDIQIPWVATPLERTNVTWQ